MDAPSPPSDFHFSLKRVFVAMACFSAALGVYFSSVAVVPHLGYRGTATLIGGALGLGIGSLFHRSMLMTLLVGFVTFVSCHWHHSGWSMDPAVYRLQFVDSRGNTLENVVLSAPWHAQRAAEGVFPSFVATGMESDVHGQVDLICPTRTRLAQRQCWIFGYVPLDVQSDDIEIRVTHPDFESRQISLLDILARSRVKQPTPEIATIVDGGQKQSVAIRKVRIVLHPKGVPAP